MTIHHAEMKDVDRVMAFYAEAWRKDHPMAVYRGLMEYQHCINGQFRYIIAEEDGVIYGAIGYIKYNETSTPDISSTMVCVRDGTDGLLSFELAEYLESKTKCENHFGIGLDPGIGGLLVRARGCELARMRHYYRLADIDKFSVACVKEKKRVHLVFDSIIKEYDESSAVFDQISTMDDFLSYIDTEKLRHRVPYKDSSYFRHRYFEHPVYEYKKFGWLGKGILIGREQACMGTKVFRIVDWVGEDEDLSCIGIGLDDYMARENIEYCDMYNFGINDENMKKAGFVERMPDDETIIPDHFDPFERKNVELLFSLGEKNKEKLHIYKGDSDQDRPNSLDRR